MPSLSEIDARRRATPLFQQAIALEQRMTAAIGLGKYAGRLIRLRWLLRQEIQHANAVGMTRFLALYGPCFEFWIEAAASRDTAEAPAMGEARPAQFALGKAA